MTTSLTQPPQPASSGHAVVIIPARGDSRGVPMKNLERVGGVSLVGRAVQTATSAPSVRRVVVSTDPRTATGDSVRGGRLATLPRIACDGVALDVIVEDL